MTGNLYKDTDGKLYTDVMLETPFTAIVGESQVQIEMLETNVITIGVTEYTRLTAGTYKVKTTGNKELIVGSDGLVYELGLAPESTNLTVV